MLNDKWKEIEAVGAKDNRTIKVEKKNDAKKNETVKDY